MRQDPDQRPASRAARGQRLRPGHRLGLTREPEAGLFEEAKCRERPLRSECDHTARRCQPADRLGFALPPEDGGGLNRQALAPRGHGSEQREAFGVLTSLGQDLRPEIVGSQLLGGIIGLAGVDDSLANDFFRGGKRATPCLYFGERV